MMRLIKENVERIAATEAQAARLIADGFQVLEPERRGTGAAVREETTAAADDIHDMTVKQLRTLAKEKGIEGGASLNREELLEVLKGVV